jgi:hypothetical protein
LDESRNTAAPSIPEKKVKPNCDNAGRKWCAALWKKWEKRKAAQLLAARRPNETVFGAVSAVTLLVASSQWLHLAVPASTDADGLRDGVLEDEK